MKEIWYNIQSLGLTVVTVGTVVPVIMAVMWLTPIVVILILGVSVFSLYKVLLYKS